MTEMKQSYIYTGNAIVADDYGKIEGNTGQAFRICSNTNTRIVLTRNHRRGI